MIWPPQEQQPSVSVVMTVWGVASTTSQAQLVTDTMIPSIPTTNTVNVMNQQPYVNLGMMNPANEQYNQPGEDQSYSVCRNSEIRVLLRYTL